MKKSIFFLLSVFTNIVVFAQIAVTQKIALADGQKITIESTLHVEASIMGFGMNTNSNSRNIIEVKSNSEKNYTLTNTLTQLKVDMDMMGKSTYYDSEKKAEADAEMEKTFGRKLNKPIEVIVNKTTKNVLIVNKENNEITEDNSSLEGILNAFVNTSDSAVVAGAFELIPVGKNTGDSWSDSITRDDTKITSNYILKSLTGNNATIEQKVTIAIVNKMDYQGTEIEMKSTTQSIGETIVDIATGQVTKRTSTADISGSMQLMGQEIPITGKITSSIGYK